MIVYGRMRSDSTPSLVYGVKIAGRDRSSDYDVTSVSMGYPAVSPLGDGDATSVYRSCESG